VVRNYVPRYSAVHEREQVSQTSQVRRLDIAGGGEW
jgi:hypothetical protein